MILEIVLSAIILLAAIPIGLYLARTTWDELLVGRKWFKTLEILSSIFGLIFLFIKMYELALTFAFILIVSAIAHWKSFDKKWTKRRV